MSSTVGVGGVTSGGGAAGERRGSMSDQPLLCKPALEREVTESLKIVNPDFAPHLSNSYSSTASLHSTSARRVIKSSGRNYGSFTNTACTDSFFQHKVQPGETLQAISLKYNISIEQLKRINRLYSNEAFFLKETILIPCPDIIPIDMPLVSQDGATSLMDEIQVIEKRPKQLSNSKSGNIHGSSGPKDIPSSQHRSRRSKSPVENGSRNGYCDPNSGDELNTNNGNDKPMVASNGTPSSPNISDIFSRFDSALAATKSNVEKLTQNSCITPYVAQQNGSNEDTFGGGYRSHSPNPVAVRGSSKHSNSSENYKGQSKKSSDRVTDTTCASESVSLFPESKRHDELYKL